MKILRLALICLFIGPIYAESVDDFLQTGFGARSAALGGAYSAAVSDPSALHWNPAGLGHIRSRISGGAFAGDQRGKVAKGHQYTEDDEFNQLLQSQSAIALHNPAANKAELEPDYQTEVQLHMSTALQQSGNLHYLGAAAFSVGDGALAAGYGGNRHYISSDSGAFTPAGSPHTDAGYLGYGRGDWYFRWGISLFGLQQDSATGRKNAVGGNLGIQYGGLWPNIVTFAVDLRNLGVVERFSGAGFRQTHNLDPVVAYSMRLNLGLLTSRSDLFLYFGATTSLYNSTGRGARLNFGLSYRLLWGVHGMVGLNDTAPSLGLEVFPVKSFRFTLSARRELTGNDVEYAAELVYIF